MTSRSIETGSCYRAPRNRRDQIQKRSEYQILSLIFLLSSCYRHLPTQPSSTSQSWQHRFHPGPIQVSSFAPTQHFNAKQNFNFRRKKGRFDPWNGSVFLNDVSHLYDTSLLSTQQPLTEQNQDLNEILKRYGFGKRLISLRNDDLEKCPIPAELFEGGNWKLCIVFGLRAPSFSTRKPTSKTVEKPPLLEVLIMDENGMFTENVVVDLGQITTLWQDWKLENATKDGEVDFTEKLVQTLQSTHKQAQQSLRNNIFPIEKAMQALYNNRIANRSRPPTNHRYALTKKQIPRVASRFSDPSRLEELLRNLLKVGEDRMSRMVDSSMTADYLYPDFCQDGSVEQIERRIVSAEILTNDGVSGGRFKRRSCQFVSVEYDHVDSEVSGVRQVTLVNGGWISVDPSVKAGAEGRKFATLGVETSKNAVKKNSKNCISRAFTVADERIAHRLECLAMGDIWSNERNQEEDQHRLELDVREALTNMNLPLTPEGATSALIQIGRWSENQKNKGKRNHNNKAIEPWPPEVLEAARSLAQNESKRRVFLANHCSMTNIQGTSKDTRKRPNILEGRIDLSSLPCVCIDAKRASFRDDSIGIRLRSSTGRKVSKDSSRWEVLIHIADVSDLYFDQDSLNTSELPRPKDVKFSLLREAAERRGQSRYDLPFGPLHLLPPVGLEALSFVTDEKDAINRCVTLWAYIDERNGKLLDAGLERTIVSSPKALSFADATAILEDSVENMPESMANTKALLGIAERNLLMWNRRHMQINEAAKKREKRLATREYISNEIKSAPGIQSRDDGVGGSFQRSRGHRMVDSALELYAFAVSTLMSKAKQPIPRAAGSGADRGGRLGTAPLRRYIDGIAQRQALSVLCNYGNPLSVKECRDATKVAARASDSIANIRSLKDDDSVQSQYISVNHRRQVSALHELSRHLASTGGINEKQHIQAISTGHNNHVVVIGVGATARCRGVKGTLKGGEKVIVQVIDINPEKGVLDVKLV
mmetsp:Transcript_22242/g.46786  ORF Transcript_22242/g.46786 Transcript_22242/m.46786 type:complete len:991 (-) Transcript_22242:465-3437(-)